MENLRRLLAPLALTVSVCLATGPQATASTINAASAAVTDVQAAVNSAVDGDIVVIPSGTAKWTSDSKLSISGKAITLQGAGVGKTIIQDAAQGDLISWNLSPGASRMTGIEFQNPARTVPDGVVTSGSPTITSATANFTSADLYTGIKGPGIPPNTYIGVINSRTTVGLSSSYTANVPVNATTSGTPVSLTLGGRLNLRNGLIKVVGSNTDGSSFRWDNCKWSYLNGNPLFNTVIGVVDHLEVWWSNGAWLFNHGTVWDGQNFGDGSWAAPTNFGSSQFLFLEDNVLHNTRATLAGIFDNYGGARVVARFNTIYDATFQSHGTESTQRERGIRAMEAYNNTLIGTTIPPKGNIVGDLRSGVAVFHDNTVTGYGAAPYFLLQNHRSLYPYNPWGAADGTSEWDINEPGGPFWTGTAASFNNVTVTVNGSPGWTTNQWVGYSIKRTTNLGSLTGSPNGIIQSNTSNTLTYAVAGSPTLNLQFTAGDSIELRKVNQALDQPGRVMGSLISGNPPVSASGSNDQVTEPCYSWSNRNEFGTAVNFQQGVPLIRINEHYIINTALPAYTSYPYPHPLVSGLPAPPGNLRIIP